MLLSDVVVDGGGGEIAKLTLLCRFGITHSSSAAFIVVAAVRHVDDELLLAAAPFDGQLTPNPENSRDLRHFRGDSIKLDIRNGME